MPPQILLQQALYVSSALMALAMQHTIAVWTQWPTSVLSVLMPI